jgi:hypothetical protein
VYDIFSPRSKKILQLTTSTYKSEVYKTNKAPLIIIQSTHKHQSIAEVPLE